MNLLVTGCAGFIGAKVCQILLDRGDSVTGIDNLNEAYDVRLKQWRLNRIRSHHPEFRYFKADIADGSKIMQVLAGQTSTPPVDAVINLGARPGVRASIEDPRAYYESNTLGTMTLLEACKDLGVKKFVLASTSSVYGAGTESPFKEDSHTSRPLSPYAASKKAAETLAYTYHHLYGIDVSVLRYFTVYGPAGRPDMSVLKFIHAIWQKEYITLFGNGNGERDFTYIDDIAAGTVAALKPLGYEIINLGMDKPTVVSDLIVMIETYLGESARIHRADLHSADVLATRADIKLAKTLLGWEPKVSLRKGIGFTIEWYRENHEWLKAIM